MIKETRVKKDTKPLPTAPAIWLKEIAAAYRDAEEAIPFGPMAGVTIISKELFHLAPSVCLKFRSGTIEEEHQESHGSRPEQLCCNAGFRAG